MEIENLHSILKLKQFKPKIYSIVLTDKTERHKRLWLGIAYSLDEAFEKAYIEAIADMPRNILWKIEMWIFKDIDSVFLTIFNLKTKKINKIPVSDELLNGSTKKILKKNKNELLKKIIEGNDIELYKKNENIFSKEEKRFVKDELKNFIKGPKES